MKTTKWEDLKHKSSPERIAQINRDALAELDRVGFAAVRKAREQTQVELAGKLGMTQASVSAIESNSDLLLSTLRKYIEALGGRVEVLAVFPEATFQLDPFLGTDRHAAPQVRKPRSSPSEPSRTKRLA